MTGIFDIYVCNDGQFRWAFLPADSEEALAVSAQPWPDRGAAADAVDALRNPFLFVSLATTELYEDGRSEYRWNVSVAGKEVARAAQGHAHAQDAEAGLELFKAQHEHAVLGAS